MFSCCIYIFLYSSKDHKKKTPFGFVIKFSPGITEWFMLRIAMPSCSTGPKDHCATKQLASLCFCVPLASTSGLVIAICWRDLTSLQHLSRSSSQFLTCCPNKTWMQRNNSSTKPFFTSCSWANGQVLCAQKIQQGPRDRSYGDVSWFPKSHKRYARSSCAGLVRRS